MNQEKQKVKVYSADFRVLREASDRLRPADRSGGGDLGINPNTLHTWITKQPPTLAGGCLVNKNGWHQKVSD